MYAALATPFGSAGASRPPPQKRGRRSRGSHDKIEIFEK